MVSRTNVLALQLDKCRFAFCFQYINKSAFLMYCTFKDLSFQSLSKKCINTYTLHHGHGKTHSVSAQCDIPRNSLKGVEDRDGLGNSTSNAILSLSLSYTHIDTHTDRQFSVTNVASSHGHLKYQRPRHKDLLRCMKNSPLSLLLTHVMAIFFCIYNFNQSVTCKLLAGSERINKWVQ